jgi:hypothetical protein
MRNQKNSPKQVTFENSFMFSHWIVVFLDDSKFLSLTQALNLHVFSQL